MTCLGNRDGSRMVGRSRWNASSETSCASVTHRKFSPAVWSALASWADLMCISPQFRSSLPRSVMIMSSCLGLPNNICFGTKVFSSVHSCLASGKFGGTIHACHGGTTDTSAGMASASVHRRNNSKRLDLLLPHLLATSSTFVWASDAWMRS